MVSDKYVVASRNVSYLLIIQSGNVIFGHEQSGESLLVDELDFPLRLVLDRIRQGLQRMRQSLYGSNSFFPAIATPIGVSV
jgi:hypothetical protein